METALEVLSFTHRGLKTFPNGQIDTRSEYEEDLIIEAMEMYLARGILEFCKVNDVNFASKHIQEFEDGTCGFVKIPIEIIVSRFMDAREQI